MFKNIIPQPVALSDVCIVFVNSVTCDQSGLTNAPLNVVYRTKQTMRWGAIEARMRHWLTMQ